MISTKNILSLIKSRRSDRQYKQENVDADKLKEAVIETVEAHPYLKTRIVTDDEGILKQYRDDDVEIEDIEIVEVDSIDEDYIMKNDIKAFFSLSSFGTTLLTIFL